MRSYKEVKDDKNYQPSSDEIKAMQDALNLVGFMYNCKPNWAPIAENLYAEAFYSHRAMPAVWNQDDEEYYVCVWFNLLDNNRELEIQIGPNILEIETTQIFKYDHDFCFEKSNEISRQNIPTPGSTNYFDNEMESDDIFDRLESIEKNGFDIEELRAKAKLNDTQKKEGSNWFGELTRLVRLSKKNEYKKNWENEYGSKPENTPYDDVW